ncbi:glycosyltransferase family 4 protein [Psychrobacillus antarcticus]|uniref:glycosyltransferase family 4 protein n=1 Tax=Psychrobacillus antarcticus TaxID=2879115 RepID=UPI002407CB88|nr:glycosyltransferase family 4 protein [Psychrobacillus antarcticus]
MKIVQLITHMYEVGGAQVHVLDLSKRMVADGNRVSILYGTEKQLADELYVKEIEYIPLKHLIRNMNLVKDILAFIEIRKTLKQLDPDIVAIHSSKAGILGRIACWTLRIPFVFTAHGWAFTDGVAKNKQVFYRRVEKCIGKISKIVITVCDYDRILALQHQVLSSSKLITIHNGVMDQSQRSVQFVRNDIVKILMVARFDTPKKQLELLHALLQIRELNWYMIFAGDGRQKEQAAKYVQEQNLGDKVTFLGNHSNVSELLKDADIFVLTSAWEGLPLSILEAMAHGLPIIASNVGGVKEAVRNSENGFLIEHNLPELLTTLIENPSLRKSMGKKSREIYEASFTFEQMYSQTFITYKNLIKLEEKD